MKRILFALLLISGCSDAYMTNEEAIKQTKLCEDNNMRAIVCYNGFTGRVWYVTCLSKEEGK